MTSAWSPSCAIRSTSCMAARSSKRPTCSALFDAPQNAYTASLLAAARRLHQTKALGSARRAAMSIPILSARSIVKSFGGRSWFGGAGDAKRAVDTVDLDVNEGETLAIVGESGSGKSTLARILLGLVKPTSGEVAYYGQPIDRLRGARLGDLSKGGSADLPGPGVVAQSADARRHDPVERPAAPRAGDARHARRRDNRAAGLRRPRRRPVPRPLSASTVGRPAAADRDRPGHGGAAPADHRRRAAVEPRHVGPGADPRPAGQPEIQPQPRPGPDQPRSQCRRCDLRSGDRHVSRQDRRGRPDAPGAGQSGERLHAVSAGGQAGRRSASRPRTPAGHGRRGCRRVTIRPNNADRLQGAPQ